MRIKLKKLFAWGPNKPIASIDFDPTSHLIFGPTDTGKSYVVQCIRYCLGDSDRPEDIGWSSGYTLLGLQISIHSDAADFTLFRDMIEGSSTAFRGAHELPPQSSELECDDSLDDLLLQLAQASNRRLLTKPGRLSNLTVDALRHVAIFDEIQTLDKVPLEGKDKLLKVRNRSAISLVLSGADDSAASLVPTSDKRNIAKGHVEALEEERVFLLRGVPDGLTKSEAVAALSKVSNELDKLNLFINENAQQLDALKREESEIERRLSNFRAKAIALTEGLERFRLLDQKYQSDRQRLSAIAQTAHIIEELDSRPCPLCLTDLTHQARHVDGSQADNIVQAARAEYLKIDILQRELQLAIQDLERDLQNEKSRIKEEAETIKSNRLKQASMLMPEVSTARNNLVGFSNRQTELSMVVRDFERIESLQARIETASKKAKTQRQTINRDLADSANSVCRRVTELLTNWGVPGVQAVSFDEAVVDIRINERRRVSFGKGKRGIFLTAYIISMMEHAISIDAPHLGFVVIDSPVVTYRDPKHGSADPDEALDISVKDRFYSWLTSREDRGQIIVLENEEPESDVKLRLSHTEFVGMEGASGRKGFYPIG